MKSLMNINLQDMVQELYEELSEEQLLLLSLKGAIEKFKHCSKDDEKEFLEAFIMYTYAQLEQKGYTW